MCSEVSYITEHFIHSVLSGRVNRNLTLKKTKNICIKKVEVTLYLLMFCSPCVTLEEQQVTSLATFR